MNKVKSVGMIVILGVMVTLACVGFVKCVTPESSVINEPIIEETILIA